MLTKRLNAKKGGISIGILAAACLLMGLMPQGLLDLIREAVTL